jgi:NTE family protein
MAAKSKAKAKAKATHTTTRKRINLALQGGGAHGAFTWGVLDRLLDAPEIEIAAISGTSAGALNGAAVKKGLAHGSTAMAKDTLEALWQKVGAITDDRAAPWLTAASPMAISRLIESTFSFQMADSLSRMISPYASGPFYRNPLTEIVGDLHCPELTHTAGPQFHICATNVRSGKVRIFTGPDITPDAIMASACLPTMFQAVEIPDPVTGKLEAYWDGGYTGNPALFPLYARDLPRDILVVNINPLYRDEIPKSAPAIQNRINEISFNSSLFRELRAIEFVQRLLRTGTIPDDAMKNILLHMVSDDQLMRQLSVATKTVATPQILHQLRAAGQAAADVFLRDHIDKIGVENSVDLVEMFG